MEDIKEFTTEEIKITKEKQYNRLKSISENHLNIMNQKNAFEKMATIRDKAGIKDKVTVYPLLKYGLNEKTVDVINNYIIIFNKYCDKYNIEPKDKIHENYNFETKFNWVNKMHDRIDLFPPMLKKACKDIISNEPTILTQGLYFHYKYDVIGYFRESNLFEDFLLCSSYKAWKSCAAFGKNGVGQNSPFIYSQVKSDRIVFLFKNKEDAINGDNAIARMIVSKFDNQILTHRLYSDDLNDKETIKKGYLNSSFNIFKSNCIIDMDSHHKIENISIKDAYPDISHKAFRGKSTSITNNLSEQNILDENLSTLYNSYKKINRTFIFN